MEKIISLAKTLLAAVLVVSCTKVQEPALLPLPKQPDHAVYARARVRSPRRQTVGLLFETQDYSRSERDPMPPQGAWDYRHSRLWLNGAEILPPEWVGNTGRADRQDPFGNANCAGRAPIPVSLDKGWNEILIKVPVGAFSTPEYRLVKWMFT